MRIALRAPPRAQTQGSLNRKTHGSVLESAIPHRTSPSQNLAVSDSMLAHDGRVRPHHHSARDGFPSAICLPLACTPAAPATSNRLLENSPPSGGYVRVSCELVLCRWQGRAPGPK